MPGLILDSQDDYGYCFCQGVYSFSLSLCFTLLRLSCQEHFVFSLHPYCLLRFGAALRHAVVVVVAVCECMCVRVCVGAWVPVRARARARACVCVCVCVCVLGPGTLCFVSADIDAVRGILNDLLCLRIDPMLGKSVKWGLEVGVLFQRSALLGWCRHSGIF